MTITTQRNEFGGIETPDDEDPGTIDVRWAEDALRAGNSDPPSPLRRLPARRLRRALRRVLAALAIAGCLVVAILMAPGDTSPMPPSTPVATATRPHPAAKTTTKSIVSSTPFPCLFGQPNRRDAIERFALIPDLSCVGALLGEQPNAATRSGG